MGARVNVHRSRAARFGRVCGAFSVPVFVLTALGQRFSMIPENALIPLISTGIVLGIIACAFGVFALVDIWKSGDIGGGSAVLAIVYSIPGVALFAATVYALAAFPKLNDITTDLSDPPQFLALDEKTRRIGAPTLDERRLQLTAYPDITARLYPVGIEHVFQAAHALVDLREWPIVRQTVPAAGAQTAAIQAVSRTLLFQFPDYVVIRIQTEPGGTRVDIRSASTVGQHDLGQNARRIRDLLSAFDLALQGERSDLQSDSR